MTKNDQAPENWQGLACYLQFSGRELTPLSREVAGKTIELARGSGALALAVVIGAPGEAEYEKILAAIDFDRVMLYLSPVFHDYQADVYAEALIEALDFLRPAAVLLGADDLGKDMAPLAAAHFRTGLTADCTGLEILPDGNLLQIRPAFGGNVMAEIITPHTRPQMATVRGGIFSGPLPTGGAGPQIIYGQVKAGASPARLTLLKKEKLIKEPSISEARFILAVGCGLKTRADVDMIDQIAAQLGARLAGTRGLVDRGWLGPERQIGLSGHTVAPELLVALGVSGSVQFLAGIGGARRIVAVNNDPEARIFSVAHQGLCCDLYEMLPHLTLWANSFRRPGQ